MSEEGKKRWLLKDRDGRVRGPFYTDDILARISRGEFSGEELISLYPNTNWIAISKDPQFYDKLLESLDDERRHVDDEVVGELFHISDNAIKDEVIEPRPAVIKNKAERISHQKAAKEEPSVKPSENRTREKPIDRKKHEEKTADDQPIIEMKNIKKVIKRAKAKKLRGPGVILITVAVGLIFYLLLSDTDHSDDRIHLLAPRKGQTKLSPEQVKPKVQRAISEYVKDTYSSYLLAQTELVQILEGDPQNAGVIALACLNYLELWPFAHQDSADLQTIVTVTQMASKLDPAGVEAATCRTVDLMVRGRYLEAKGVTEMVLDTFGRANKPPIAFYYFKARLFEAAKDYSSAISYAQSAEQLWKQWLRVYSLEAEAQAKAGHVNEAVNRYRMILKANPNHVVSRIELGVLEYKNLGNYQESQRLLEMAMSQKERAPRDVLARGYLGLAEIALYQQDQARALKYAQKSYSLNSSVNRTKEIIISIGGEKKLRDTKIIDLQLVYEGDQLVREGDCAAAQAHYKAAYELNKKNGLAAMKAAECLWALSLSTDAMSWLNNAIRSEPELIDAYVLLADYYTQRYNYIAAGQILSKAKSQTPTNYKVYRGFALVELRRNNSAGAINYAKKAIQLYEADVESYVILARALLNTKDLAKAFEAASKGIEIDLNNRQAQIVYAEALGSIRGTHVGIDYLNRLVNTYPTITEYRLALGQLYAKDQNYSSAAQVFEQVARIEDKPKKALVELGKIYQLQKRFEDARNAFFKAASLDPADVEPLFIAGQLYLETKQPSEARQQFQRVLRINKEYPLVNYYIGRSALQMGSANEAIEQANLEKAKNPNLADPYLLAAEAFTELKQYRECAGEYSLAVKLRPASSDIYVKLARCYRMSGNLDAAVSMINQAGRQESGNPEVWKEQGAIYEVRQEAIKAIEAYSQYLVLAPNALDRDQIQMRINALSR